MEFEFAKDDLSDGQVIALLKLHLAEMHKHSPAESVHALNESQLLQSDIHFFSARINGEVAACGALKVLDDSSAENSSAEIKSMKTASEYTRQGLARRILIELIALARIMKVETLYLETGTAEVFSAARTLYTSCGFVPCEPFGTYQLDPHSCFYSLNLNSPSLAD